MILQIIIGILILGILVLIHEAGHFLAAKANGIRVLTFSIGFGPPLFTWSRGEDNTQYQISSIPFGGYVHMAGENPEEENPEPDSFSAKPVWRRAVVAIAGPAANLVFSFILLFALFLAGTQHSLYLDNTTIGAVAENSPAARTELQPGDSIVALNGNPVGSWEGIQKLLTRVSPPFSLTVIRNSEPTTVQLGSPRDKSTPDPIYGLRPPFPAVIGGVVENSPAEKFDIPENSRILEVNGENIHSWFQFTDIIMDYDTVMGPLSLTLKKNERTFTVEMTPEYSESRERYLLGLKPAQPETQVIRYPPGKSIERAANRSWEYATLIFVVIKKLITGEVDTGQLAGPVGIVQMSAAAADVGLQAVLAFTALIGINLAILNLLPLVITDGGMLLFLAIEKIRGRPLSTKKRALINRIAVAFFIALFLYVTLNDLLRIQNGFTFGR
ncbi:MAG: RIP metalloprotease RseP [Chitinivibrionales bacterium]|nr:RIP metalloprotease RseP [Chitinivibrionales bacterium]